MTPPVSKTCPRRKCSAWRSPWKKKTPASCRNSPGCCGRTIRGRPRTGRRCARKKTGTATAWSSFSAAAMARRFRCCGGRTCRDSSAATRCTRCNRGACSGCAGRWPSWSWKRSVSTAGRPQSTSDAELRQLLDDLAEAERRHEMASAALEPDRQPENEKEEEARVARQLFVLQVIQPGLVGLMDGSVSTLAPLFAAAFATMHMEAGRGTWATFLVGLAASVGAGISMGFAEALSDDGSMTGRGRPLLRGVVCGADDLLRRHLPRPALPDPAILLDCATGVAVGVVAVELMVIAWIRNRYMDSPFVTSVLQVVLGGVLVFLAGILIGSS